MEFTDDHALALGIHSDVVDLAKAAGIPIAVLIQLLITYGPAVLQFLAQLFGWKLPPNPLPTPLPLPLPVPGPVTKVA